MRRAPILTFVLLGGAACLLAPAGEPATPPPANDPAPPAVPPGSDVAPITSSAPARSPTEAAAGPGRFWHALERLAERTENLRSIVEQAHQRTAERHASSERAVGTLGADLRRLETMLARVEGLVSRPSGGLTMSGPSLNAATLAREMEPFMARAGFTSETLLRRQEESLSLMGRRMESIDRDVRPHLEALGRAVGELSREVTQTRQALGAVGVARGRRATAGIPAGFRKALAELRSAVVELARSVRERPAGPTVPEGIAGMLLRRLNDVDRRMHRLERASTPDPR